MCCDDDDAQWPCSSHHRVADLEAEQRRRTQNWDRDSSSTPAEEATVAPPSDAVLQQRTYFTPVMFAYVLGMMASCAKLLLQSSQNTQA